jgi:hypothetical protein
LGTVSVSADHPVHVGKIDARRYEEHSRSEGVRDLLRDDPPSVPSVSTPETPRTEEWRVYVNDHGKLVECEADGPDQFIVVPKPAEAPVGAERERLLDLIEELEANLASLARVVPAPSGPMERLRNEIATKIGRKARDLLREYDRLGKEES